MALNLDPSCFTSEIAEEKETRASHPSPLHHLDFIQHGRVEREDAFYSDTVRYFPNRKAGSKPTLMPSYNNSFKDLNPFLVTFFDAHMDPNSIPGPELGQTHSYMFSFHRL